MSRPTERAVWVVVSDWGTRRYLTNNDERDSWVAGKSAAHAFDDRHDAYAALAFWIDRLRMPDALSVVRRYRQC